MMNSIKPILLLAALLFSGILNAQDFLGQEQADILDYYEDFRKEVNADPNSGYQIALVDSTETVAYHITGKEVLDMTFLFAPEVDVTAEEYCNRVIQDVHCKECMDKRIHYFLDHKERKWRTVGDDEYIASTWMTKYFSEENDADMVTFPKVTVEMMPSQMIITLFEETMEYDAWIKLIKDSDKYKPRNKRLPKH
ncbi:MAG: hypothetical protein ACI837_001427 [Crocinitomicaceae bacterium]|jgi:hypothetical protein